MTFYVFNYKIDLKLKLLVNWLILGILTRKQPSVPEKTTEETYFLGRPIASLISVGT